MKVVIEINRVDVINFIKVEGISNGRSITISQIEKLMKDNNFKQFIAEDILLVWTYKMAQEIIGMKPNNYKPSAPPEVLGMIDRILAS